MIVILIPATVEVIVSTLKAIFSANATQDGKEKRAIHVSTNVTAARALTAGLAFLLFPRSFATVQADGKGTLVTYPVQVFVMKAILARMAELA